MSKIKNKYRNIEKKHYEQNKDKMKEIGKQYRENNKEKIKERRQQKITCCCGSIICNDGHKARHERSQKHVNFINNKL